MAETNYQGSCHCGAVRYRTTVDLSSPVISCNCSICTRSGTLLTFVPPDKFTLESGEDNLTNYQFNKKAIDHLFCKTCGIKPFSRGQGPSGPMIAVNVRCLEGVDVASLSVHQVDGKSF